MISETKYKIISMQLGIDICLLEAVANIESAGNGFLSDGQVKILWEPHVWWRTLKKYGLNPKDLIKKDPSLKNILYEKWGTLPYGKISEQHPKLQRAVEIHKESALEAASYGMFQVLGENWKWLGYNSLQDFINTVMKDEDSQLDIFCKFIVRKQLVKHLREKNIESFCLGYNGKGYKKNQYDVKIRNSYLLCKQLNG